MKLRTPILLLILNTIIFAWAYVPTLDHFPYDAIDLINMIAPNKVDSIREYEQHTADIYYLPNYCETMLEGNEHRHIAKIVMPSGDTVDMFVDRGYSNYGGRHAKDSISVAYGERSITIFATDTTSTKGYNMTDFLFDGRILQVLTYPYFETNGHSHLITTGYDLNNRLMNIPEKTASDIVTPRLSYRDKISEALSKYEINSQFDKFCSIDCELIGSSDLISQFQEDTNILSSQFVYDNLLQMQNTNHVEWGLYPKPLFYALGKCKVNDQTILFLGEDNFIGPVKIYAMIPDNGLRYPKSLLIYYGEIDKYGNEWGPVVTFLISKQSILLKCRINEEMSIIQSSEFIP